MINCFTIYREYAYRIIYMRAVYEYLSSSLEHISIHTAHTQSIDHIHV